MFLSEFRGRTHDAYFGVKLFVFGRDISHYPTEDTFRTAVNTNKATLLLRLPAVLHGVRLRDALFTDSAR